MPDVVIAATHGPDLMPSDSGAPVRLPPQAQQGRRCQARRGEMVDANGLNVGVNPWRANELKGRLACARYESAMPRIEIGWGVDPRPTQHTLRANGRAQTS
jgi:hypothetical protein